MLRNSAVLTSNGASIDPVIYFSFYTWCTANKIRTCLVISNVSKKNALDDVFWLGVYSMAMKSQKGDMNRFYDVLIPFLTGKPLESTLVEAEQAAMAAAVAKVLELDFLC